MRNRKLGRKRWIIPPMIIFLMVTLAVIVITALLAPVIAPIDLGASDLTQRLKMPKFKDPTSPYLFGTDNLGRDVAIRLLYATRSTIMISFTGMIIATVTGTALGILSGLGGKWIDAVLSFFTDVRLSIPTTFIGIIFACILGAKPVTTILVMAITGWSSKTAAARVALECAKKSNGTPFSKNAKFIEASRSMGASGVKIVFEHILVNIASPLIVQTTMELGGFILLESTLSFLGLGIEPPGTSLGVMVSLGRDYMLTHWWLAVLPSIIIVVLILDISLIGDWLRDRLDPKLKNAS